MAGLDGIQNKYPPRRSVGQGPVRSDRPRNWPASPPSAPACARRWKASRPIHDLPAQGRRVHQGPDRGLHGAQVGRGPTPSSTPRTRSNTRCTTAADRRCDVYGNGRPRAPVLQLSSGFGKSARSCGRFLRNARSCGRRASPPWCASPWSAPGLAVRGVASPRPRATRSIPAFMAAVDQRTDQATQYHVSRSGPCLCLCFAPVLQAGWCLPCRHGHNIARSWRKSGGGQRSSSSSSGSCASASSSNMSEVASVAGRARPRHPRAGGFPEVPPRRNSLSPGRSRALSSPKWSRNPCVTT